MIQPSEFYDLVKASGIEFFAGVPDSLLKSLCAYIEDHAPRNIITANEGNAIALAAGHYLGTGRPACVYMQNSGLGNAVNPLLSLMDQDVYKIPVLLVIGWRGEPGVHDEPQHVKQGKVTTSLLETMGIEYTVLDEHSLLHDAWSRAKSVLSEGSPFAFVVRKGAIGDYTLKNKKPNISTLSREKAIRRIITSLPKGALIISTTGMISRELFELREQLQQGHESDFLTVGSMGHTSQIAMGLALGRPDKQVFCLDGDGSFLMHLGSVVINASLHCPNFKHIILNNAAHDSVGGQPTVAGEVSLSGIASACGYENSRTVDSEDDLAQAVVDMKEGNLQVLVVCVSKGARKDLGRPTISPQECKRNFMDAL